MSKFLIQSCKNYGVMRDMHVLSVEPRDAEYGELLDMLGVGAY